MSVMVPLKHETYFHKAVIESFQLHDSLTSDVSIPFSYIVFYTRV